MSFWNGSEWVAETPPVPRPSRVKRIAAATLEAALIASLMFGLIAGSVFAAKGGGGGKGKPGGGGATGGTYTVTIDQAGPYSFGQDITVTTNAPVYPDNRGPWIDVSCAQNGSTVFNVTHAGFEGGWYYNWPFRLGPTYLWTGGAADCTVRVWHQANNKMVTDARTQFHVDG